MNNQELMAGWARERLIAIHRATPAPGGDVTALAYEVARSYGELATFLPGVQPPPGDPGQWAPGAVVKAGAAVIGVLDELRTPGGPGKSHDLPELFFAASVQRTLTGGPDAVTAACVSALTGDAEQLWARAFGKLLVYAISVPLVGLIDDLTRMLAEAVAAWRWINLQRQLTLCRRELVSSPVVGVPEPVESQVALTAPAALPNGPGQVPPSQPKTPSASHEAFGRPGSNSDRTAPPAPTPERSAARPERVPQPSTSHAGTSGPSVPKRPETLRSTEPPAPRDPMPQVPPTPRTPPPSSPRPTGSVRGVAPTTPGAPGNGPLPPPRVPSRQPTTPSQRVLPRRAARGTPARTPGVVGPQQPVASSRPQRRAGELPRTASTGNRAQPGTPPAPALDPPGKRQSITVPARQSPSRRKLPYVPSAVEAPSPAPAVEPLPERDSVTPTPSQSVTLPARQAPRRRRLPWVPSVPSSSSLESRVPEIGYRSPSRISPDHPRLPPASPRTNLPEPPGSSGPGFPGR